MAGAPFFLSIVNGLLERWRFPHYGLCMPLKYISNVLIGHCMLTTLNIVQRRCPSIGYRGQTRSGTWAPTLYKVDCLNVLLIMQKNRSSVRSTVYLVKLVEMHRKKSYWS